MAIKLVKTLWGVDDGGRPDRWDELFARIKAEGFDAVEAIRPVWRADVVQFQEMRKKHGLALVCQIHTTGGGFASDGEYEYCTSAKVEDHIASFEALVLEAAELNPVIINSHSGHDSWDTEHALKYLNAALAVEKRVCSTNADLLIVHETHRQRLFFSPYSTASLLSKPELVEIKLNADLSHWCCVCEHVFDASLARDSWWPETLALVSAHCRFVHCRVGHAEGPQARHWRLRADAIRLVADPEAPECRPEVEAHFGWWRQIWAAQAERGGDVWAEPEFGPPPYMQTLPHTGMPVAQLWDVNDRIAKRIRREFAAVVAA